MVRRFELWSVAKVAFLFHLCCGFLSLIVCVGVWLAADRIGTRDRIESFLGDLLGTENFQLFGDRLFRAAAGATAALVLLATVGTILMAFVYNMLSGMFGGIVVSVLQERTPRAQEPPAHPQVPPPEAPRRRRVPRASRGLRGRRRRRPAPPQQPLVFETRPTVDPAASVPATPSTRPGRASPGGAVPGPSGAAEPESSEDWLSAAVDTTGSWMRPDTR